MEKELRRCPKCGSTNLKSSLLLSGSEMAMQTPLVPENPQNFFCNDCGYLGPVFEINKIPIKE